MSFVETVEPLYMVKQMPEWLRFAGRHRRYALWPPAWQRDFRLWVERGQPSLLAMSHAHDCRPWQSSGGFFGTNILTNVFSCPKRYCLSLLYGSWCMIGWCCCNQRNWVPLSIVLVTLQAISFAEAFFTHSFDVLCCWDMGTGAGLLHILHIQSRT